MTRFDLTKPGDRNTLRTIARSERYAAHPLAATLIASLDLIDRLVAEAIARNRADDTRRQADRLAGSRSSMDDIAASVFGRRS